MTETARKLAIGLSLNDRVLPLVTGQVASEQLALSFTHDRPSALFWRALSDDAFDVTEMSLAAHAILTARGDNPFVGLPVFTSRMFRHNATFVAGSSGYHTPADLDGCRIGLPEYQMTAAVWARGFLQNDFGLPSDRFRWVTGGVNTPGRSERLPLKLPATMVVDPIGADETLNALLLDGAIDAIIAPQIPSALQDGSGRVRRLFMDPWAVEQAYFRATGIFPIMHLVVVRRALAESEPQIMRELYALFDRARRMSLAMLADGDALAVMVPSLLYDVANAQGLMGADYWPYGIAPNRRTLDAFLRHLGEQHLLETALAPEDLFHPMFQAGENP